MEATAPGRSRFPRPEVRLRRMSDLALGTHAPDQRTPSYVHGLLALGVAAASQSGNLVRIGDAHAAVMAAWRLTLATLIMAALAGRRLRQLLSLEARHGFLLVGAGVSLALHLMTWIAAVQHTTVANAAIFFSINPVLTAVGDRVFYRERVSTRLLISILLGVTGVAVMGAGDLAFSRASLVGDGYAVLCSLLFTAYFLLGKTPRRHLDNRAYVAGMYACASLASFVGAVVLRCQILSHSSRNWLCFVLLAVVPTAMGHTSLNAALRYMQAARISTATLAEPLLAGLVAYFAWGEQVRPLAALGYLLIGLSVVVLVSERRR